ncbi:Hsp70 family protein [Dactylosporangium sp. NPDC000244]|uniref:Hsp70 family protein n=1 Tax=Dactylosporangium sp. NPDC000244 TaxID=3154365 RepID=UPI003324E7A8
MPFRFAVDLGTSNTVAVVDRGDGTPRPLLFDGSPLLPSAVFADASGALLVGRDAERHLMTDAARFEPNPKGRVDEGVILLGDRELPVAELLAAVLRRAATEAAQTGVPVTGSTVLTCPVDWGNTRRSVLLDAAARAGLGRVTLLDEPVSAATYCVRALGGRLAPGRCAVVFDFGGGTLDVTVVQATGATPALRVLATGGLADLGGTDVDDALVGHVGHLVAAADPQLWRRLAAPRTPAELRDRRTFWSEVRQAKEMLSRAASAPIHVPGGDHATHLTREELDRVAGPLVDRAVDETRRVLERSGVTPAQLEAIVLVGGSSRLPLVASRLHARFGLAPVVPEQPELPVAFGALLLANGTAPAPAGPPPVPSDRTSTGTVYGAGPSTSTAMPPVAPVSVPPVAAVSSFPVAPASVPPVAAVSSFPAAPASVPPVAAAGTFPPAPGAMPPVAAAGAFPPAPGAMPPVAAAGAFPPAPASVPPGPAAAPRRPSVIIGPGVTIQGNVAIYGDDSLMPRDEPEHDEPAPEPPRSVEPRRRGGMLRRLRFAALPLLPVTLVMVLTPWGRALLDDGRAKAESLFGAGPSPSTSAPASEPAPPAAASSAPATPPATVQLQPSSGKAGVAVKLTANGFAAGEKIEARAGTKLLTTLTADADGAAEASVTAAPAGTKAGAVVVQLVGRTSRKSATATYRVAA